MFDFDKSVEIALKTWYPVGHELRSNPHHPLMKLIGEWGELLGDYVKLFYKPDYVFEPINELGGAWYYERILSNIFNLKGKVELSYIGKITIPELDIIIDVHNDDIDILIDAVIYLLSAQFLLMKNKKLFSIRLPLNFSYSVMIEICRRYNISLQQLTDSNWQKLKPGSERGEQWMKARLKIDYVDGKVAIDD